MVLASSNRSGLTRTTLSWVVALMLTTRLPLLPLSPPSSSYESALPKPLLLFTIWGPSSMY